MRTYPATFSFKKDNLSILKDSNIWIYMLHI